MIIISSLDSFNDFHVTEKSINDELSCKVNSSEQCTNRWIFNSLNGSRTALWDRSNVTAEISGLYRCESECNIRRKRCTVSSVLVYVPSGEWINKVPEAYSLYLLSSGNLIVWVCENNVNLYSVVLPVTPTPPGFQGRSQVDNARVLYTIHMSIQEENIIQCRP